MIGLPRGNGEFRNRRHATIDIKFIVRLLNLDTEYRQRTEGHIDIRAGFNRAIQAHRTPFLQQRQCHQQTSHKLRRDIASDEEGATFKLTLNFKGPRTHGRDPHAVRLKLLAKR